MKILAVGGGSGGHVTPVLAVINSLAAADPTVSVRFVCDKAFESQSRGLMEHAAVPVRVSVIAAGKLRRYHHLTFWQHFTVRGLVFHNIIDMFKIGIGFIQSLWILLTDRPQVVFAKGGYVCLPLGYAARLLRIPLVIHDSDSRPGLTSRLLAPYATAIATGYPLENYHYPAAKAHYTGVPIDHQFERINAAKQAELKQQQGFPSDRQLVVVTGGGLGSKDINDAALKAAIELNDQPIDIYNVTGKKHYTEAVRASEAQTNYTPIEFVYEGMAKLLGAADVVVTRASATFLQELAGLGKAAIIIPARQLADQQKNAEIYRQANAAEVLSDDAISTTNALTAAIESILQDPDKRRMYEDSLHAFAKPDAANTLANIIIGAIKHKQ